ncbi:GDP-mannose 4,6-dehydratase [Desulfonatronum thioautotrophicum]|uniref:GDP-mannose 4,6-dehydratase n=1 Tax=Desulfonatronum thioautotrophicum TaxID=617001 RepID=UPI0005EAFD76|nr:GDP-mannose 4,6-dehydratase [Desulfonatronum thioautotrophicum]
MPNRQKNALIMGISGQDGAYLARFLLDKGYRVFGTSRDVQMSSFANLRRLEVMERVTLLSVAVTDFRSVLQAIIRSEPDEIYNLAGQSSVGLSFEQPMETFESISVAVINLLEAIRFFERPVRLYNAGSSECFGNTQGLPANEETPFRPRSPYAVAKSAAFWEVANYREAYGLYACSGILFNHESPLRPERFVTQKIVAAACRIAREGKGELSLGNIEVQRDWGWAPEYVEAMWQMLQQEVADDYVIATGKTFSLEDFTRQVFEHLDLDWTSHVRTNPDFIRPTDIMVSRADPSKADRNLGWRAQFTMPDVARMMVEARIKA